MISVIKIFEFTKTAGSAKSSAFKFDRLARKNWEEKDKELREKDKNGESEEKKPRQKIS